MIAGVRRRSGVGVRHGVVDLSPGDLDWDRRRVCLEETLVVLEPFGVGYDGVRRIKVGQQIQRAGSAVPAVRLVGHSKERVVDSAKKLLAERAVNVRESVKGERCRVVGVPNRRCFRAGRAGQDERIFASIEVGGDSCGRGCGIDGGG